MKLITYVNFAGKCAEAFHYYEQHLGAKFGMMMTHGQNPAPSPYATGEWKDAVLHARIAIGGTELAGCGPQKLRSAYPPRTALIHRHNAHKSRPDTARRLDVQLLSLRPLNTHYAELSILMVNRKHRRIHW
jgi:hypothetical protein